VSWKKGLCVLAASLLAFAPFELRAEESNDALRLESAKTLFRQGVTLLNAGDTERALEAFLRSRELVPSGKNTANAAICLERLGRHDEALEMYEEVLTRFAADLDEDDRASLVPVMQRLRQQIGYLELSSNVDGLVVVDGRSRGRLPLSTALRLLPGRRVVRVLKDGYRTFEQTMNVEPGKTTALDAALEPLQGRGAVRIEGPGGEPFRVYIDDKPTGNTPFDATFPTGRHVLRTERGNEGTAPAFIDILEGKTLLVRVSPESLGGPTVVLTTPSTAELFLGDVPLGKGIWRGRLPIGRYEVSAREAGYVTTRARLDVKTPAVPVALRLDLSKDPEHPRWPAPKRFHYDAGLSLGPWIAPTLASDAESSCPNLCAKSRVAIGGFAQIVAGVRHESGFGGELTLGYSAFRQRFVRAVIDPWVDRRNDADVGGELFESIYAFEQTLVGRGPLVAARARLRRPTQVGVDFWATVGGGVFIASYETEVQGSVWTVGEPVSIVASPMSTTEVAPLVTAALGAERKFGPIGLRAALGVWFFPALGPVFGGPSLSVVPCESNAPVGSVSCTPESDALVDERAHGRFLAFTPEIGVEYSF
jgi:hypothetical protein